MIKIDNKKISINKIKNEFNNLIDTNNSSNKFWKSHSKEIIDEFLNQNPINFLRFNTIGKSMFVGRRVKYIYYEYLKLLKNKKKFINLTNTLRCNNFGNPKRFPLNLISQNTNSNMIHQAYHLLKLKEETNINIENIHNIFEFGGGYGALCKIFFNSGFKGNYFIYDLPIMSIIQKFWISNSQFNTNCNIFLTTETKDLEVINESFKNKNNLFISNWALSESPIHLRNQFEKFFNNYNYLSLAIQDKFQDVDNKKYLINLKEYLFKDCGIFLFDKKIRHIKNSSYVYGIKI